MARHGTKADPFFVVPSPEVGGVATAAERKTILGGNPAAGAEFSVSVPVGKHWELVAISVVLVQGLTQLPRPVLVVDDGTNIVLAAPGSSADQVASTTCRYTWAPELPFTGQIGADPNVHSTSGIPGGFILPPGYRVRSSTLGLGINTDYGAPALFVVEYA